MNNTNAVVIEPTEPANASVIWLHGLGANGHDFEPIVQELSHTLTRHTRFIFPHAPYDVIAMELPARQDTQGIHDSEQILCQYVSQEIERGISTQRIVLAGFSQGGVIAIVLAGFSQGGVIALHTGLRYAFPLAGIMVLSAYLPLADTVEKEMHTEEMHTANCQIPIFMAHGQDDPVISFSHGERSRAQLEKLGYEVEWHSYSMQHSVNAAEIVDIRFKNVDIRFDEKQKRFNHEKIQKKHS